VDPWSLDILDVPDLSDRLAKIDSELIGTCSRDSTPRLASALRMVSVGGKRIRPALTIATAGLGDVFDERVIAAAVAVELVQVGSLVHDDIFDKAQTRRGIPTINAVEGPNEALLVGTFLLAQAASKAASAGEQVAMEVARTVSELCVGQTVETEHLFDVEQEINTYLSTIGEKTAALFACACRVGGITGGLSYEEVKNLGAFGRHFGMAFQIVDDVLDLIGNPERLGKPVGNDLKSGVLTLPILLELSDRRGGDVRALLVSRRPADLDLVTRTVIASGRVDDAIAEARSHARAAEQAIINFEGSQANALARFGSSYVDWALEYFSAA